MKLRMNPIVKKDLNVTARSMRICWGVFAYELVLALAFLVVMLIIQEEYNSRYSTGNVYGWLVYLFPVVAVVQVIIVALVMPILTASSISGERERQTLDIMLTTCMSPLSIVTGKVTSAICHILLFVIGSTPIMALSFVVGGLSWVNLLYFVLAITLFALFSGSVGIFCSALCKRSIAAVILSYVIYGLLYGNFFFPLMFFTFTSIGNGNAGDVLLMLLINPAVFFEEILMQIMTGESLLCSGNLNKNDVGFLTYYICEYNLWIPVSALSIFMVSVLFLLLAAWRVNPMHSGGYRRKKKVD